MNKQKKVRKNAKPKLTFSEREINLSKMRNGRIERSYLTDLVMDYKMKKKINPDYIMPRDLAEVLLIIIDKMLGSASFRGYSEDWKEEFRGRAIEHVIKYGHNFDATKSKNGKNDPYNYFAMVIHNAFIQSMRKCKTYSEHNVDMNPDIIYNKNTWKEDQEYRPNIKSIDQNVDTMDWGQFGLN